MRDQEKVILLDDEGNPLGEADKAAIHTQCTPLHLAFSCYLFDQSGELLLQRRALTKLTWPGVWTNSFCGHPAPGESVPEAIARRAGEELGCSVSDIEVAIPDFRYRAVDASGIVENEICPVYTARLVGRVQPNLDEVAQVAWIAYEEFEQALKKAPFAFSPWSVLQVPLLGLSGLGVR